MRPIEVPAMVLPEGASRTENRSGSHRAAWTNDGLRWAPFNQELDLDDQRVTVTLIGREPEQFWAKSDGFDPVLGVTRYKLLPMDRA